MSTLAYIVGMPMVNVLESTLEWTSGEVIVNSGTGPIHKVFTLDSASVVSLVSDVLSNSFYYTV
jgi:hypothetical protein